MDHSSIDQIMANSVHSSLIFICTTILFIISDLIDFFHVKDVYYLSGDYRKSNNMDESHALI